MIGYTYVTLRQKPEWKEQAAIWFHEKWGVPKEAYLECMEAYLCHETEYGWHLCLDGDRIVGGLGVIANDFHDRKDLTPNVCAVYTEKEYRGQGIAGHLLNTVVNVYSQIKSCCAMKRQEIKAVSCLLSLWMALIAVARISPFVT